MSEVLVAHKLYFLTAKDNFDKAVEQEAAILRSYENDLSALAFDEINIKFQALLQFLATSIIFSALTAEAYINYYSATRLSNRESESLDKLDPVSKWLIVPKMVTGRSLNPGNQAICLLQKLVKTRNKLTHYKIKRISREEQLKLLNDEHHKDLLAYEKTLSPIWLDDAKDGILAIEKLIEELQLINPEINTQDWDNGTFSWYTV
jgi:hypothetical protein